MKSIKQVEEELWMFKVRKFFHKNVLCCLLKMNKYFDMNEVNKIVVNTLL